MESEGGRGKAIKPPVARTVRNPKRKINSDDGFEVIPFDIFYAASALNGSRDH